jgi:hypothetical protein
MRHVDDDMVAKPIQLLNDHAKANNFGPRTQNGQDLQRFSSLEK